MSDDGKFLLVVTSTEGTRRTRPADRGIRDIAEKAVREGIKIPAENLRANLESFLDTVLGVIGDIPETELPYALDEIEICAEISAEGTIQLIGGITAGAKGGITLRLKRSTSNQSLSGKS